MGLCVACGCGSLASSCFVAGVGLRRERGKIWAACCSWTLIRSFSCRERALAMGVCIGRLSCSVGSLFALVCVLLLVSLLVFGQPVRSLCCAVLWIWATASDLWVVALAFVGSFDTMGYEKHERNSLTVNSILH